MALLHLITFFTAVLFASIVIYGLRVARGVAREGKVEFEKRESKEKESEAKADPEVVAALVGLGFKKKESVEATKKAMQKIGEKDTETLIKEALRQI